MKLQLQPFALERYFAAHEFTTRYVFSASDCQSLKVADLLVRADAGALGMWRDLDLCYTDSQGHRLLRQEIASLYGRIDAADILVLAPEEGIFVAMLALLSPGDHVIAPLPGYQSLSEIAGGIGCPITPWGPVRRGDGWALDLDALAAAIEPTTRLLILNFPHNPTGYLPTLSELEAILRLADRHGLYVFSDEMYRWLEYEAGARLPSVVDLYDRGVTLAGLSKGFSLPGLRIGWLAAADRSLTAQFCHFRDYTTICSSAPSEVLGIMALRDRDWILDRNLQIIGTNLRLCETFCRRHGGLFEWLAPSAGSVAFPAVRPERLEVREFCRVALEQESILIVPGDLFGAASNHFRIGLGRLDVAPALERLEELVVCRGWSSA